MVVRQTVFPIQPEAFPSDAILPQVRIASDGAQMCEIFRRYLRPSNGRVYEIQDCILTRIRHRQATRCILQYSLVLQDTVTGREQIQWVSGVTYHGNRAEHIWKKLSRAGIASELSRDLQSFEPITFIPELNMLVQLFPFDHRLPALPLMMTGLSSEIESLLLADFELKDWSTAWTVEPIRYRAGLAVVLRYKVQARHKATGRIEMRRFYAKIYRDERGEEIYQVLHSLWEKNSSPGEHFTVGRPIAYLSNLHVLFQEEASGTSFQEILIQDQDHEAASATRKVARALASLHLDHIPTTRRHLLQDEVAVLKMRGRTLQWASPHLNEEIASIVSTVVASIEEVAPRPAHLDLNTDHILLDRNHYALLDLDSFALADPILDVAHVLAQIFAMQFRFAVPRNRSRMAAQVFTEEYFNHVPRDWRSRLRVKYAGAALDVAVGFFRRQEPQWLEKVAALIDEAKASLAGRSLWRDFHALAEDRVAASGLQRQMRER